MTTPQEPNVLRTSEIGKRLQEEWPDAYTSLQIELECHVGTPPRIGEFRLYHERVTWHLAATFEECIAKVKEALAVKAGVKPPPPPPPDVEVVIDPPAEADGD